mmetsp:Transcript_75051/g.132617  ORF Transcript_75051/g.132617 Transcript_75051/m.132617 type:complete len:971 (-) Transcript_75051:1426-4338(-)
MHERLIDYFVVVGAQERFIPTPTSDSETTNGLLQELAHMSFVPQVEDRVPMIDHLDTPFPNLVEKFCIPSGVVVKEAHLASPPVFFGFQHTYGDGATLFGASLQFDELVMPSGRQVLWNSVSHWRRSVDRVEHEDRTTLDLEGDEKSELDTDSESIDRSRTLSMEPCSPDVASSMSFQGALGPVAPSDCRLVSTRSLCILSHWPYFTLFEAFLTDLHVKCTTSSPVPLERYIQMLMRYVPSDPFCHRLQFRIGSCNHGQLAVELPPPNRLPFVNVPLHHLFQLFSIDNVLTLFSALLLERKLLFLSNHLKNLQCVMEALCSLLFPFKWFHVKVPLLPSGPPFPGFVNAPVPFLMGACADDFDVSEVPLHVIVVAVDKDSIHMPADPDVCLPRLPPRAGRKLLKGLKDLLAAAPKPLSSDTFPQGQVCQTFLRFFVSTFRKYRQYISDNPEEPFRTNAFLADQPQENRPFLRAFLDTNAFEHFIDDRLPPSSRAQQQLDSCMEQEVLLFDESIIQKENRSTLGGLRKKETPFLDQTFSIKTVVVDAPLPGPSPVKYPQGFPKLKQESLVWPDPPTDSEPSANAGAKRNASASWRHILSTLTSLTSFNPRGQEPGAFGRLKGTITNQAPPAPKERPGHARQLSGDGEQEDINGCRSLMSDVSQGVSMSLDRGGNILMSCATPEGTTSKTVTFNAIEKCPKCNSSMNESMIHAAMRKKPNPNDYRIACPKCSTQWVPYLWVTVSEITTCHALGVGEQRTTSWRHHVIHYSAHVLRKEVVNLQKQQVMADHRLSVTHPTTFWNILFYLRKLQMPLDFVLPQVDWNKVCQHMSPPSVSVSVSKAAPPAFATDLTRKKKDPKAVSNGENKGLTAMPKEALGPTGSSRGLDSAILALPSISCSPPTPTPEDEAEVGVGPPADPVAADAGPGPPDNADPCAEALMLHSDSLTDQLADSSNESGPVSDTEYTASSSATS